jgi:hypothetical protein
VVAGEAAGESAAALGISTRTVELHRQQILLKLGAKNMVQVVRLIALVQREGTGVTLGQYGAVHAEGNANQDAIEATYD